MKLYVLAMIFLIAVSTTISGLAPGGWDALIPKIVEWFGKFI